MKLDSLGLLALMLFGSASVWGGTLKVPQPPTDCQEWWTGGGDVAEFREAFRSWEAATESTIKGCLAAGADVTARDDLRQTPLHFAAWHGSPESVEALLAAGAAANARNEVGDTPLHVAAVSGDPQAVKALLAADADPDARNEDGHTPLHRAALDARLGALKALIAAGAEVRARDRHGDSPLHLAAENFAPNLLESLDDRAELVRHLSPQAPTRTRAVTGGARLCSQPPNTPTNARGR